MTVTSQKVTGGIEIKIDNRPVGKITYKQAVTLGYALLKQADLGLSGR